MRLSDLDACFVRKTVGGMDRVESLAEADGVMFQCPRCAEGKPRVGGSRGPAVAGAHYVVCWFRGKVSDDTIPGPGRWEPSGVALYDLTLTPSVDLGTSCGWHGWVKSGDAS